MSQPDYLISTPENVDLHLELAGLGNRVLACLIDTLITYGLMLLVALLCFLTVGIVEHLPLPTYQRGSIAIVAIGLTILISFGIYFGYYIFFEGCWHGQTPGKRIAHIRVIEQNGQPATWPSVIIRNLLRVVDTGFAMIGLVVMLVDRNERRIGDLAGGTLVIRERLPQRSATELHLTAQKAADIDVGRLTPREYDLLLSFLERREKLSKSQRPLIAKKLESHFRTRLEKPSLGESAESFLESLYLAYQARAES